MITPNPYAHEVIGSMRDYPAGWTVPELDEQRKRTRKLFPDLTLPEITDHNIVVPEGWDSVWYFLPKIAAIARICGVPDCYGAGYDTVVKHVLALIGVQRAFTNHLNQQLTAEYIRINKQVRGYIQALESATEGDFSLPMPISFGKAYAGFSPRNARETAMRRNQLPLCTAHVASLLALMPERLVAYDNLWIDVPGDEYNWGADGTWTGSLCFGFGVARLWFGAGDANVSDGGYGSVVGSPGVPKLGA